MSTNIKTWQERMQEVYGQDTRGFKPDSYMPAEITDLRAALAATQAPSAPQEPTGDDWITAKVARHLDMQFRNGVTAGWNAGITEDNEALARLKNRVGTRAEYEAAFPAPSALVAPDERAAFETWFKNLTDPHVGDVEYSIKRHAAMLAWQARAALSVKAGSYPEIPEGWKLVPENPTGDMFRAANKVDDAAAAGGNMHGADDEQIWHAMYFAAPTPPTTGEA